MYKRLQMFFRKNQKYNDIIREIENVYAEIPSDSGGGCSVQKGLTMAAFIMEYNLEKTADIGVYRGRSLFPQAIAHKKYTNGIVYGIDPYSKEAAIQNDHPEINDLLSDFLNNTDFNKIYTDVIRMVNKKGYEKNCLLVREKSEDAINFFKQNKMQLGLIHIDGNHDTIYVMKDINNYFPLVKQDGIIVLDDISWNSVKPAYEYLLSNASFVGQYVDNQNDFGLFMKTNDSKQLSKAKSIFGNLKTSF